MIVVNGVYALVISVGKSIRIKVGALGALRFEKGMYIYVGSAQKGLKKRVQRHLRREKRMFWHIDYLLNIKTVKVTKVFCRNAEKDAECKIAMEIGKHGVAVDGFGSSDCRCKSHLFRIKGCSFLRCFMRELQL